MSGPIVFLVTSGFVCVSASLVVQALRLRTVTDAVLAWAVVASAIVIATLLVAGAALQTLAAWLVLTLNGGLACSLALIRHRRRHRRAPHLGDRRVLSAPVAVLRADLWLSVLVVVAFGEVVWRLTIAYLMPPYAADALWYHLTTVAGWLQAGRIGASELTIWSTVYPYNGELLFSWPALLLGNDTFVDAVQLPLAIVAAVAVAGIGRIAGLSRAGAAAAGCLFFLSPIVLSQTTASYTDVIFVAFFLCAFYFVLRSLGDLRSRGQPSLTHVLLAGLAGGLALGTKTLGLVYLGVLSLLFVGHLLVARVGWRTFGQSLSCFAVPLLALGSYHYLETWVRFGNPLYPVRISAFGVELFPGRAPDWFLNRAREDGSWWREVWGQWRRDYFFLVRPRFHAYSYDDRDSGLGPLWSYLSLPLLPIFALRLLRTNRSLLLTLVLPVAAMFALQPYRWWSRFTMILIALGVIGLVALAEALPARPSVALKAAVLALTALGIAFPTLKIDGEFWATRILAVARLPAHERTIGRVAVPGYRWVDAIPARAAIGADTSAAFLGGGPYVLAYPLFGPHFEHRVYSLPQSRRAAFERALTTNDISYVFVRRRGVLDRWMESLLRGGCARRIYDGPLYPGDFVRAYRLLPGCTATVAIRRAGTAAA